MSSLRPGRAPTLLALLGIALLMPIPSLASHFSPPADESESVSNTNVDPVLGELLGGPPNSVNHGAVDHSADVVATGVNPVTGDLISAPANSTDQGAVDHSADVAATAVDAATGNLIGGAPGSTDHGSPDYTAFVAATSVNAETGDVQGPPPGFEFPINEQVGTALSTWGSVFLVATLLLAFAWFRQRPRPA